MNINGKSLSGLQLLLIAGGFYLLSYVADMILGVGTSSDLISGGLGTIGLICLLLAVVAFGKQVFSKNKDK